MIDAGIPVSGSDAKESKSTKALRQLGARISIGHAAENLGDADTLVVTSALWPDNPEYVLAKERGIPILHRSQALAWVAGRHRLIAVAGAHGKTTSTGMIVTGLLELGQKPGFVNGGVISALGTSSASGEGEIFVLEADESDGSFLLYDKAVALITNVDPDHLDHYGSVQAVEDAFVTFADEASELVVISADDAGAVRVSQRLASTRVLTFGEDESADVRLHSVETGDNVTFQVSYLGTDHPGSLLVPGRHNALNAAGAFAVLVGMGFAPAETLDEADSLGDSRYTSVSKKKELITP
jgi:UDP-N-acetylmuramate--alanine ligase